MSHDAGLAKALKEIGRDARGGSIELAHKAIMALFRARRDAKDPERFDRQWLRWARVGVPEMRIFENLARAAAEKPGRLAWARKKSLAFWLITVLYNSMARSLKSARRLIRPGDRILVYSYSWTLTHLLTLAKDQHPEILVPTDRHSLKTGRALRREGLSVRTIELHKPFEANKLLISCDAYDRRGNIINARGTSVAVAAARRLGLRIYCVATWLKQSRKTLARTRNKAFELVAGAKDIKLVGDL